MNIKSCAAVKSVDKYFSKQNICLQCSPDAGRTEACRSARKQWKSVHKIFNFVIHAIATLIFVVFLYNYVVVLDQLVTVIDTADHVLASAKRLSFAALAQLALLIFVVQAYEYKLKRLKRSALQTSLDDDLKKGEKSRT